MVKQGKKKACKSANFYHSESKDWLLININTAKHTDKIKNMLFVEQEALCKWTLYADDTSLFSVFHDSAA